MKKMTSYANQRYAAHDGGQAIPSAHNPFPGQIDLGSYDCDRSCLSDADSIDKNPNRLLDRREAASYLRVQPQTLANWVVSRAQSLPYVKIGRRVMYRLTDLEAFIMANRRSNEAVMGGANA